MSWCVMTDEQKLAWAYLSRVAEPPCVPLATLVADVGPVDAAQMVRQGAVGAELRASTAARRDVDRGPQDLEVLERLGGRLITPNCEEWPHLAFSTFNAGVERPRPQGHPPLVLWALGPRNLADVAERACAIVGTRVSTAYGDYVAADFAAGLVERDVAVVSGAAYGIDGVAHRAALAARGVTVALLASGLDVPYPVDHSGMLRRIGEDGLVVTEYPPGVRPARHRFLTRNRLVAACSGGTIVVEAGLRSGAASTASWARTMNRPVCAVPGPITSAASAGCHVLLRDGAHIVTRAADILELVGRMGEVPDDLSGPVTPLDGLTDVQRRVYDGFPGRAFRTPEELAEAVAIPVERIFGPLTALELAGLVTRRDGRWRLKST